MSTLRIEGQHPLHGEIHVSGSKNSVLKLLNACVLTDEPCRLFNVPRIEDVYRMVELLGSLGAICAWTGEHELTVQASDLDPSKLDQEAVRRFRSSVLLMGAIAGRGLPAKISGPGGDQIGARPLEPHFHALRSMGIRITESDGMYELQPEPRGDVDFTMSEFSVTATENAILVAALANGYTTIIRCAAFDPSVQDLCWFLVSLGAKISGIGTPGLTIIGVKRLHGTNGYTVMPDPVEVVTFMALAATVRSEIRICGAAPGFLSMELQKFREANARFEIVNKRPSKNKNYRLADIVMYPPTELKAIAQLHNMPYPGFVPDALPPLAVMLTQATGISLVHDWMYEGRLRYVEELNKMGAEIFIADPHRILVHGPVELHGTAMTNYDIRAGASLVIAALVASGESTLAPVYQLDRGYEKLDERLRALGAHIQRIE